ncbi:MAG TPA: hypothetical protein VJ767_01010 [Nitrososphaeraceae archaeon]|nr:hypothetical protein [Nitrososphaeraceae archaeon]
MPDKSSKYCWQHQQIYISIKNLYVSVFKAYGSTSWQNFLLEILDNKVDKPWKTSLIENYGKLSPGILNVITSELQLSQNSKK